MAAWKADAKAAMMVAWKVETTVEMKDVDWAASRAVRLAVWSALQWAGY